MAELKKEIRLFGAYAVSVGTMFSAGFFLLPGIAFQEAGPAMVISYLLASIFILPSLLSMAELATGLPKASGSYFFIDRSLGPLMGSIGGFGTWLALVFESAFALIGMGAYLALLVDWPIKVVAVSLTVAFALLNIFGVKETTGLQKGLVAVLVAVVSVFVGNGLVQIFGGNTGQIHSQQFIPFFEGGLSGLMSTTALVFVSYAGISKWPVWQKK